MGNVTPENTGPEARLPRIETAASDFALAVGAPLMQAVEHFQKVRVRWEAHMALGEGMDPAFRVLDQERRQAIQAVMEISAFGPDDLKAKLEALRSYNAWCGPDERVVPLALSLAEEVIAFLSRDGSDDKRTASSGGWGSPGRWLIGAASSVPAFILERFGPG
jgi:hypothetical protein